MNKNFDENLKWYVDVDWYYRILTNTKKVKILNSEQLTVISDLTFSDTITNKLDISSTSRKEREYLKNKYGFKFFGFYLSLFSFLKIPVYIFRFLP
jgi:hypothetical protein